MNHFKKGSVLINIGRGALVVEEDLIEAINSGHLKGATLDVVSEEPMPSAHPFWEHPNIFITPHVSGWNVDDAISDIAFNYNQLINNKPLLHEIERGRGY
ncbi:MAG: NAD(P)-dependent oxidoreductase [Proteobacteria bacterium]|nr:NAD(P)-dependent oxidoreductase [Pseudomonadota bacterium]